MSSVKDLDLLLQSFVDKGIPGCALKVVQNGTTLYEGYFGHSDTSGGLPSRINPYFGSHPCLKSHCIPL